MLGQMEVTLIWVGNALFVRGTIIQVAYICQQENGKWGGIVLGLEGKGVVDDKKSSSEVKEEVKDILLQADKCQKYRSNINGEFLKCK